MSKKTANKKAQKTNKKSKAYVQSTKRADGYDEYYITTAPQKTIAGKVIIWVLVALMALGSVGSLIIALINLSNK